jgi:hypothetical protein
MADMLRALKKELRHGCLKSALIRGLVRRQLENSIRLHLLHDVSICSFNSYCLLVDLDPLSIQFTPTTSTKLEVPITEGIIALPSVSAQVEEQAVKIIFSYCRWKVRTV